VERLKLASVKPRAKLGQGFGIHGCWGFHAT
jgi:hypothetical protein